MIDQITNLVRQYAQGSVIENPAIPNEQNEAVIQQASGSIVSGLQSLLQQQGGLSNLVSGLQSGNLLSQLQGTVAQQLQEKSGVGGEVASQVSGALVPQVLGQLVNQVQSGNFNLQEVLSNFGGGGNVMDQISSIGKQFGLDKDNDGDVDLGDVMKMFGK